MIMVDSSALVAIFEQEPDASIYPRPLPKPTD
jgi:uncharacterized protein with PIN domain